MLYTVIFNSVVERGLKNVDLVTCKLIPFNSYSKQSKGTQTVKKH